MLNSKLPSASLRNSNNTTKIRSNQNLKSNHLEAALVYICLAHPQHEHFLPASKSLLT